MTTMDSAGLALYILLFPLCIVGIVLGLLYLPERMRERIVRSRAYAQYRRTRLYAVVPYPRDDAAPLYLDVTQGFRSSFLRYRGQ